MKQKNYLKIVILKFFPIAFMIAMLIPIKE